MSKYLVSIGDSDNYAVEFPGSLEQFKNSDKFKDLKDKVASFLKEKVPMGGFADIVPIHVEEAKGTENCPTLDASTITDMLKNALTQIGVQNFTSKLNLNAPFDKE